MATPTAQSGNATPACELDPEETKKSLNVSLADLCAKATALYAKKKYEEAAEVFAQAAEMQAEMNGEMNPENAEILFLYGRALFKVGQAKSDVLGGKAPDAKKPVSKAKPEKQTGSYAAAESSKAAEKKQNGGSATAEVPAAKKGLFQFEGDQDFDDSEEDEEEGDEEEEEEEDDLAVAFEVLDLARVLLNKKLEALQAEQATKEVEAQEQAGKGKEVAVETTETPGETLASEPATIRHIKERLADTHDLLAEISLENERYHNAITDSRASLKYKQELYPFESEIIAEAHFKLSLALEFASVTKNPDDEASSSSAAVQRQGYDPALRAEAAAELEKAIESTKLKLQNKEVELATLHNPEDNETTRRQIADVKEVLADMEQRLIDLKKPPIDLNAALGMPPAGSSSSVTKVSEDVAKNATDLTGLVRKKNKRKAEEPEETVAAAEGIEAKKPREEAS